MNIGILTFHRGPNYGAYLQAWHLREAIRRLGHSAEIINYQNAVHFTSSRPRFHLLHPSTMSYAFRRWQKARFFQPFIEALSPFPFTTDASAISWNRFDTVVVGSDIVWDFQTPCFGHDPAYFGMHPSQEGCRFVSYAASCGAADVSQNIPDWVRKGIARFPHVGVRDSNTLRLAKESGANKPALVVDPTWLQDDPPPVKPVGFSGGYVLIYGNVLDAKRAAALREHCRGSGLKMIGIASAWKYADKIISRIDPFQCADLFRKASAVVTSTLHGLLYAIKYEKPFLMAAWPATLKKSQTIIERFGVKDRLATPLETFSKNHLRLLCPNEKPLPGLDHDWIKASRDFLSASLDVQ